MPIPWKVIVWIFGAIVALWTLAQAVEYLVQKHKEYGSQFHRAAHEWWVKEPIRSTCIVAVSIALILAVFVIGPFYYLWAGRPIEAGEKVKTNGTDIWLPPELADGTEYVAVGSTILSVRNLTNEGGWLFSTLGIPPIRVRLQNNRVYIDAQIDLPNGGVTTIKDGKIGPLHTGWDRNSNSNAFEIVDSQQSPVLQVIYRTPEHIVVNARTRADNRVWSGDGRALFKYPSFKYPGEFAVYSSDKRERRNIADVRRDSGVLGRELVKFSEELSKQVHNRFKPGGKEETFREEFFKLGIEFKSELLPRIQDLDQDFKNLNLAVLRQEEVTITQPHPVVIRNMGLRLIAEASGP